MNDLINLIITNWHTALPAALSLSAVLAHYLPKILEQKWAQVPLAGFLATAKPASLAVGAWFKVGPARYVAAIPVLILLLLLAWVTRFTDGVLSVASDTTRSFAKYFADTLAKIGSEHQKLYYEMKSMTPDQTAQMKHVVELIKNPEKVGEDVQDAFNTVLTRGKEMLFDKLKG